MVKSIRNAVAFLVIAGVIVFGLAILAHIILGDQIRWIADAVFVPILAAASQVGARARRRQRARPSPAGSLSIARTHFAKRSQEYGDDADDPRI